MTHISLETSKKLKEMGWDRSTEYVWGDVSDGNIDCVSTFLPRQVSNAINAPLAEELLEVLPKRITNLTDDGYVLSLHVEWFWDTKTPHVYYEDCAAHAPHPEFDIREAPCLAEALALLLIDLVEQGVVSKEQLQ